MRVNSVRNLLTTKDLPVSVGARLLNINRTSIYYVSALSKGGFSLHTNPVIMIARC